jgi:hypothetical protein
VVHGPNARRRTVEAFQEPFLSQCSRARPRTSNPSIRQKIEPRRRYEDEAATATAEDEHTSGLAASHRTA